MTKSVYHQSRRSRLGEVALWSTAALLTLSVHAGAAYYIMKEPEPTPGEGAPAAIMIELAALPEAVNTEETVEADDQIETEEVKSPVTQPVEEKLPDEVQPTPEPIVEDQPSEAELPQETVEPASEEPPLEQVEEIDPIEQQQVAALENVEVPLPVIRPPPPPVDRKVEKDKEPEKKPVKKPTRAQQQSELREIAKAEATQSNRTAAAKTGSKFFSSTVTPQKWMSKIQAQIARKKPRELRALGAVVVVNFTVGESGNLSSIRLLGSTGDSSVDDKIVAWMEKVGSVEAPPPDVNRNVKLPIELR